MATRPDRQPQRPPARAVRDLQDAGKPRRRRSRHPGRVGDRRESLAARVLRRMIAQLVFGHITVVLPSGDRIEHSGAQVGKVVG